MQPVIRFSNVSKRYNLGLTRTSLPAVVSHWARRITRRGDDSLAQKKYHWALKNVSFDLDKGQSLALVGPNGAGKSTILKLLAQISQPTQGSMEVNGQLSALIELGAGFHPDLTGRENIYLNGTILGLRNKEVGRRLEEIIAFAELDDFIDTPIKRYSSGMIVRLGFAVASCIDPDILLVDEVLAVGDASFREKCIKRIKELLKNGTSLIFVSHSMELVKAVCAKSLYLEHGEVQQYGDSSEVIDTYNRAIDRQRALKFNQSNQAIVDADSPIEITKVEAINEKGQTGSDFHVRENIEIRIHYLAYRSLGRSNIVVRIYRVDGVSCAVMHTYFDGYELCIGQEHGFVAVKLEPLQLFGGMYYAVAWIMDGENINGITRGSSDWFTVRNMELGREDQDAIYEPNRKWYHQRFDNQDQG